MADKQSPEIEDRLPARLAEARAKTGWLQEELATLSGVPKRQIARYEGGTGAPSISTLRKLCDTLKVSPSWLIYGSESPFQSAGRSIYDRVNADAVGVDRGPATMAALAHLIDVDDRRTLTDLIYSIAVAHSGKKASDLLDVIGPLVRDMTDVGENPAAEAAIGDLFQASTGSRLEDM